MPRRCRISAATEITLDVGARLGRAQHLEVDLVGTGAAGPFAAARSGTSGRRRTAQRQLLGELAVRDERAADAGGIFWPQGERFSTTVGEGVHLLADDVGRLADAAREQLGELEDRRGHLAVAIEARHVARGVDDMREAPVFVGKEIVRATHGLQLAHGKSP